MVPIILAHMAADHTIRKRFLLSRLLEPIVNREVVQLGQIFVDAEDFLMLNGLLHLSFECIALFLLLDEFLNFAGIHDHSRRPSHLAVAVLHLARLNHSLHLCLYVAICQVLLLEKKLGVFPPERGVVKRCLGGVRTISSSRCCRIVFLARSGIAAVTLVESSSGLQTLLLEAV